MGNDQCGLLQLFDNVGHGVGLARARNSQEGLEIAARACPLVRLQTGCELLDGLRLGACGREGRDQMKLLPEGALGMG